MTAERIRILADPDDTGLFRHFRHRTPVDSTLWMDRLVEPGMDVGRDSAVRFLYAMSGPFALALSRRTGLAIAAVAEREPIRDPALESPIVHWCCASYLGGGRYAWMDVRGLTQDEGRFFEAFPGHRRVQGTERGLPDDAGLIQHLALRGIDPADAEAWMRAADIYIGIHRGRYLLDG